MTKPWGNRMKVQSNGAKRPGEYCAFTSLNNVRLDLGDGPAIGSLVSELPCVRVALSTGQGLDRYRTG